MNKTNPVIGVTGPERGGTAAWLFTRLGVWLQGGKAIHLTTSKRHNIEDLDGLILGGGADVDPQHYGQQYSFEDTEFSKPTGFRQLFIRVFSFFLYPLLFLFRKILATRSRKVDKERDEMELHYLTKALELKMPVLGICRGAQLLNVKLGGTLHQDITGFYGEIPKVYSIFPKKGIEVQKGSLLADIMETSEITVNAMHHQAIDKLAPSLEIVAREESGIIQAVESPDFPFLVGVQWHPEYMPQIRAQRKIFKSLVEAAQ